MHDYNVSPAFCEYAWSQDQAQKQRDTQFNSQVEVIERVTENVSRRLIEVLYGFFESRNTELPSVPSDRDAETTQTANKKPRKGGISI